MKLLPVRRVVAVVGGRFLCLLAFLLSLFVHSFFVVVVVVVVVVIVLVDCPLLAKYIYQLERK